MLSEAGTFGETFEISEVVNTYLQGFDSNTSVFDWIIFSSYSV